jgi:hypothetical protein
MGVLLLDTQHEPPAALVERVLPHGLDALLEEEKLGAVRELVGPHDMLLVFSEVLGSVKGTDLLYRLRESLLAVFRGQVLLPLVVGELVHEGGVKGVHAWRLHRLGLGFKT